MILEILQVGDPVLRQTAEPVPAELLGTGFLEDLASSMVQTMRDAPGVGLAAPQVGESIRAFVMADDDDKVRGTYSDVRLHELQRTRVELQVLLNPTIEPLSEEVTEFFEICLSLSGHAGLVRRAQRIRLRGTDLAGQSVDSVLEGYPARIAQHECDHLDGILHVDRMDTRTLTTLPNLGRYWKARSADQVRAVVSPDGDSVTKRTLP